jgi:hypothetical protein
LKKVSQLAPARRAKSFELDSIEYIHTLSSSARRLAKAAGFLFVEGPQGTSCFGRYGAGFTQSRISVPPCELYGEECGEGQTPPERQHSNPVKFGGDSAQANEHDNGLKLCMRAIFCPGFIHTPRRAMRQEKDVNL